MEQQELTEIEKELLAFDKMIKPLVEEVKEEAVVEVAPTNGGPCVTKHIKELVGVMPESWVGVDMKDFVIDFFKQLPECKNA